MLFIHPENGHQLPELGFKNFITGTSSDLSVFHFIILKADFFPVLNILLCVVTEINCAKITTERCLQMCLGCLHLYFRYILAILSHLKQLYRDTIYTTYIHSCKVYS